MTDYEYHVDKQYHDLLCKILKTGYDREDRTGTGTKAIFGSRLEFDLTEGFPAVTTKELAWKGVVSELLWFLEGSTDERRLAEIRYQKPREQIRNKKTIWTANADHQGKKLGYANTDDVKNLGPIYGKQWRDFFGVDQIQNAIDQVKNDPTSRRIVVSAWNPAQLHQMALPPCHSFFQLFVNDGALSCQVYQRSVDTMLGLPFNVASYALLTHIIANICDLKVNRLIHVGGDVHIYNNHMDAVNELLLRHPKKLPILSLPKYDSLDQYLNMTSVDDYILQDYDCHGPIKANMSV